MPRKPLALAAASLFILLVPSAHAAPSLAGTFPLTSGTPGEITAGSDGNIWFTVGGVLDKQVGRITPSGAVTEYEITGDPTLKGITSGPDGNLWATTTNGIVKIPPGNPTAATSFNDAGIGSTADIVAGPDGHLWTGSDATVIDIPPDNPGVGDTPHPGIVAGTAKGIAVASDGTLWIADNNGDNSALVHFNTAGHVIGTPTSTGDGLLQTQIAAGSGGQVAFTQPVHTPQRIGRVDASGNVQFTNMPGGIGDPTGIVFANDGAYWSGNFGVDKLRRLTLTGDLTEPINFDANSGPRYIAKGPNDTLWVSLETSNKIAKITGVSAPPPPPVTPPPPLNNKPAVAAIHGHVFSVSGRFVTIPIACQGSTTCKDTITLRTAKAVAAKKKRKLKLGSARFSIPAGQTKRVKIKLSTKAGRLIRKKHPLKVVATVGAKRSTITLKRKK
jgi:virginiamycin B lyase